MKFVFVPQNNAPVAYALTILVVFLKMFYDYPSFIHI
jgi:hypothetical protein